MEPNTTSKQTQRGMSTAGIYRKNHFCRTLCSAIALLALISAALHGQDTQTTDLQFHKFRPKVAMDQAASAAWQQAAAPGAVASVAVQQMQALQAEKASRT